MADIDKVTALVIREQKLLVCAKRGLDSLISLGGKRDGIESDVECLRREVREEVQGEVTNVRFYGMFEGPTEAGDKIIRMQCYFCDLIGEPRINPADKIYAVHWIGRDYKEKGFKLAPSMEHLVVPALIKDWFL